MPFTSRIESESTRRVVIAVIMFILLAVSTAAAVLLSAAGNPGAGARVGVGPRSGPGVGPGRGDIPGAGVGPGAELVEEPLGWLRIARPAEWSANYTPSVRGEILQPLALFAEGGAGGRYLIVQELTTPRVVSPVAALKMAQDFLPPTGGQVLWGVRSEGMYGVIGQGVVSDQGERYEQLVAVLTTDGQRYAVLNLTGLSGGITERNQDLMRRIALSADDLRYEPMDAPVDLGGLSVEAPAGVIAWSRGDRGGRGDGPIFMTPREGGRFFRLSVEVVPLGGPLADERSLERMPMPLRSLLESEQVREAENRLPALLVVRYWQMTGELPPDGSAAGFKIGQQTGYIVPLAANAQDATYRVLWGVEVGGQRAALIHLAASPPVAAEAQEAAKELAQALVSGGTGQGEAGGASEPEGSESEDSGGGGPRDGS